MSANNVNNPSLVLSSDLSTGLAMVFALMAIFPWYVVLELCGVVAYGWLDIFIVFIVPVFFVFPIVWLTSYTLFRWGMLVPACASPFWIFFLSMFVIAFFFARAE